jgi:hypothetical protein
MLDAAVSCKQRSLPAEIPQATELIGRSPATGRTLDWPTIALPTGAGGRLAWPTAMRHNTGLAQPWASRRVARGRGDAQGEGIREATLAGHRWKVRTCGSPRMAGRSACVEARRERRSSLGQTGPPALRAAFLRGALARERTGRRRARRFAHATPKPTRTAGPRDPTVSSMGRPPMCAKGALIIGRSRLCSRRLGGAPRGLARDRRVGRGSRRRSRGRPPSRPRVSS